MRYIENNFFVSISDNILLSELNTEYKEDWAKRLNGFLEFNGNEILTDAGKISAEKAKLHAETEFEKYRIVQDRMFMSDDNKFY